MKMFPYSDYNETNGNRNPIAELIYKKLIKKGYQNPTNPLTGSYEKKKKKKIQFLECFVGNAQPLHTKNYPGSIPPIKRMYLVKKTIRVQRWRQFFAFFEILPTLFSRRFSV